MWNYLGYLAWIPLLVLGYRIHLYLLGWNWSPYLTFPMGLICGVVVFPFLVVNIFAFVKWKVYDAREQGKRRKSR